MVAVETKEGGAVFCLHRWGAIRQAYKRSRPWPAMSTEAKSGFDVGVEVGAGGSKRSGCAYKAVHAATHAGGVHAITYAVSTEQRTTSDSRQHDSCGTEHGGGGHSGSHWQTVNCACGRQLGSSRHHGWRQASARPLCQPEQHGTGEAQWYIVAVSRTCSCGAALCDGHPPYRSI